MKNISESELKCLKSMKELLRGELNLKGHHRHELAKRVLTRSICTL